MSYTVGLKRRFWFGYKTYQVVKHDWENFRYVLTLEDHSEISVPGFRCDGLKVYPDFWNHIAHLKSMQRPVERQGAIAYQPAPVAPPVQQFAAPEQEMPVHHGFPVQAPTQFEREIPAPPQQQPWMPRPPVSSAEEEAHKIATERVYGLLGRDVPAAGPLNRPQFSGSVFGSPGTPQ